LSALSVLPSLLTGLTLTLLLAGLAALALLLAGLPIAAELALLVLLAAGLAGAAGLSLLLTLALTLSTLRIGSSAEAVELVAQTG